MAFDDARRSLEVELIFTDAGSFKNGTVFGDIAAEDTEPTFLGVGVGAITNASVFSVKIKTIPTIIGGEGLCGAYSTGSSMVELYSFIGGGTAANVPIGQIVCKVRRVYRVNRGV